MFNSKFALFQAFFSIYELRTHRNNVHCPPVQCSICQKTFSSPNTLKSHMKLSHSEKNIVCQVNFKFPLYKSSTNFELFNSRLVGRGTTPIIYFVSTSKFIPAKRTTTVYFVVKHTTNRQISTDIIEPST